MTSINDCRIGRCSVCDPGGPGDVDADGYLLDADGDLVGFCDECGEEALVKHGCCGDIQPFEEP